MNGRMEESQEALTRQILDELQRERDASPDITYELRGDEDAPVRKLSFDGPDAWQDAVKFGDILSGQLATHFGIWQVRVFTDLAGRETKREASYVATTCGGTPYWEEVPDSGLHQIGSAGFCWTCLHPDYDLDQERHGLIRHPVTPEELGQPGYKCFVCGVPGKDPDHGHKDIDHTVIWGEESHPRCEECGQAYQTATPEGIGYLTHKDRCPAMMPWEG